MTTPSEDLQYAEQLGVCVEVTLLNGQEYTTGVHSVDTEDGFANLYTPQTMGDETTRTRIRLDDIESVTVLTDLPWTSG
jgi:hypothetical protein